MELNKKITCLLIYTVFFGAAFCSPVKLLWQLGDFGFSFSTDEEKVISGQINLGEIFLVESNTKLYASFSPFSVALGYAFNDNSKNDFSQWSLSSLDFVNAKVGWLKPLGKRFLFEPFLRIKTLNPLDIQQLMFEGVLDFSFILPELFDGNSVIENIGKIIDLEIGADLSTLLTQEDFSPKYYFTIKINFMCLTGFTFTETL